MANLFSFQELDFIFLDPELTQFERLICRLISEYKDQVSRSKALVDLALRSHPNSLLLALSKLLSSGLPLLRAEAAKHLGEIFTKFFFFICLDETTLDTLKSDLLSASRNQVLDPDVRNHLLRTISDFHDTGSWPELFPYLFECGDSQNHYLQEYALLVFKSLAENSNNNAFLIPHLNTFQEVFSECLGNCWNWDVKIAALDASISFVQFIPTQEDPNRFDYLLRLMMLTLTEALNSGSESKTEDSLHLLIKLAETNPRFFERQLDKVLRLMLKITVDDSLEVDIRHLTIEFQMALVEKAPWMISKELQFIKRLFDELMYMLFDIEGADDAVFADAAIVNLVAANELDCAAAEVVNAFDIAAANQAVVTVTAVRAGSDIVVTTTVANANSVAADAIADAVAKVAFAADAVFHASSSFLDEHKVAPYLGRAYNRAYLGRAYNCASNSFAFAATVASDWDEVDHFWESNNYILGKKCLSRLSILLGEEKIFQWVLRLLSHLLGSSIWQQRHAVLIAIPEISGRRYKVMLQNLDEIVPEVLKSINDSNPYVRLAAVNAITELSVNFGPELQTQYHEIVLITLDKVMKDSRRPKLQAAAVAAAFSFLINGTKNIRALYKSTIINEFSEFIQTVGTFIKEKNS